MQKLLSARRNYDIVNWKASCLRNPWECDWLCESGFSCCSIILVWNSQSWRLQGVFRVFFFCFLKRCNNSSLKRYTIQTKAGAELLCNGNVSLKEERKAKFTAWFWQVVPLWPTKCKSYPLITHRVFIDSAWLLRLPVNHTSAFIDKMQWFFPWPECMRWVREILSMQIPDILCASF